MAKKLNILPPNPEAADTEKAVGPGRFPSWLHRKLPRGGGLKQTGAILQEKRLYTVCEEAKCPNQLECWSRKTATFLIMGKECTRACGFCDIDFSKAPQPLEADEPKRVAESVRALGLKHVVITMVARDDVPDQGAAHIAAVIEEVRKEVPGCTVEVLTSDFNGDLPALETVLEAKPEIFNHNIETVRRLTPRVRHTATYARSLELLRQAEGRALVKSGMMLGLGETEAEVKEAIRHLKEAGCSIITLGQYLQPNRNKLLVKEFVTPEQFQKYEAYGKEIGVPHLYAGPFVRSSYNADKVMEQIKHG